MDGTVLVADDDRTIRTVLTQALTRAGCKVHATASLVTLMRWIDEGKGDLVISDVAMPDGNGLETLPKIHKTRPNLPVIVISAQNTIMTAIKATEADAYDYLPKPFDLPELMKRAAQAMKTHASTAQPVQHEELAEQELPLVGQTAAMQALYRLVARVMNSDLSVMIVGQSGTGKSLIARAVHDFSARRAAPFITITRNDPNHVLDLRDRFAQAADGTVFFDNINDLEPKAQANIAQVIEDLGEPAARIVSSSQISLAPMLDQGQFRSDLFYRLNGFTLAVPALRDRGEDIPLLIQYFLTRFGRDGDVARHFNPDAMKLLRRYSWPGNVRQLENAVKRLLITAQDAEISRFEVENLLADQPGADKAIAASIGKERLADSVDRHLRRYFDLHDGAMPPPGLYQRILQEVELPLIEIALDATGGNQAKCADLLGINRNTLRKKISELDIQVTRRRRLM